MQLNLQHAYPLPRVFSYSLDWRFLLPLSDAGNIFVLSDDDAELSRALAHVGIPVSDPLYFPNPGQAEGNNIQSFVLPFGLPTRWVGVKQEAQVEAYRSIRRLIHTGGCLLVGFHNAWNFRDTPSQYHTSTPQRLTSQLKQAGFSATKTFGVMPNLNIPEHIFDLESRAIRFALQYRFRRKPVLLNVLRILTGTIGARRISNFLPCYFVVATA